MDTNTPFIPALQRVQELRAEGKSLRKMVDILQSEGVPLPPGRYKKWNHMGVQWCVQQLTRSPAPDNPAPSSPAPSIAAVPAPAEGEPPPAASPSEPAPKPRRHRPMKVKIQGPWIHTDSLLWEFLIHKVWDELTKKTDHTMPIQEALDGLPLLRRRKDPAHLWEAVDRLAASRFKLEDELGSERLAISTPLLSALLTEDTLSFQFPTTLIKMVKNPQQYIRLKELLAAKH